MTKETTGLYNFRSKLNKNLGRTKIYFDLRLPVGVGKTRTIYVVTLEKFIFLNESMNKIETLD